jgi:photosystem II stability/assembly factor-like uncharacterized protein
MAQRSGDSGKRTARTPAGARRSSPKRTAAARRVELLVATQKGAFLLRSDAARRRWRILGPHFLGSETNHMVLDPRDGKTLLLAAVTGHLGPTVFRSTNRGRTWQEARLPPAFPKAPEGQTGASVKRTFFLAPGHASQPGVWWAGTVPHALFRSEDGGASWEPVQGFSRFVAGLREKNSTLLGETPGGAITHSILIDPRDADHMYVSLSTGGFFESENAGRNWRPMNEGVLADFLPEKFPEYGQDPHCVVLSPANPDRLYQQNHCGVYRLDRPGERWDRIGARLPKRVGDIGFPVVAHPRDADTLWVFPMDGTEVWPRTSPRGRPAVFRSRNGGRTWTRHSRGFPSAQGWFTVFRQALKSDTQNPVGLYLGTTNGEIWMSRDEGETWKLQVGHLPRILAIEVAERR